MNGKERMDYILQLAPVVVTPAVDQNQLLKEFQKAFPHWVGEPSINFMYMADNELKWVYKKIIGEKPFDANAAYDRAMGIV